MEAGEAGEGGIRMPQQGKAGGRKDEEIGQVFVYLKHLCRESAMATIGLDDKFAYSSTNNKNPFFLPSSPLNYLVGALCKGVSAGTRTGDAVHFEQWRYPGK